MILGRSTPQWVGLITAGGGLLQVLLVTMIPGVDAVLVATIIGSVVGFLGIFVTFLANTATTPISDPQLKEGTMIRITDPAGTVIGHEAVPPPGGLSVVPDPGH